MLKGTFQGFSLVPFREKEIDEIVENDIFPLKLTCFNCNSDYDFSKEEILEIQNKDSSQI